jgi:hypothetical protein
MDDFWPLQKSPLGYIGMNGHSGPLIKSSGRAEYEVLVPIYGLTVRDLVTSIFWTLTYLVIQPQDKDELSHDVEVVSRVYDHRLIAVWMWPECNFCPSASSSLADYSSG